MMNQVYPGGQDPKFFPLICFLIPLGRKTMNIQDQFSAAQDKVKTLPAQSNDVLLQLYSLFKQATVGDASGGKKPGMFDLVGKAKFEAWETKKGLSKEAAMKAYVELVEGLAK